MSLLNTALSTVFPSLDGMDPMILGPVLALVACFTAIGVIGMCMALSDFLRDHA
jgi:hypothetical protein